MPHHTYFSFIPITGFRRSGAILLLLFVLACEENDPVGNPDLAADEVVTDGTVLFGDTVAIVGNSFNPLTYQNEVFFTRADPETIFVPESRAKVVSVAPTQDTLRAIVPVALENSRQPITGPVYVVYGVDTVVTQAVEIVPIVRPVLNTRATVGAGSVNPRSGQPGTVVKILPGTTPPGVVVQFGDQDAELLPTGSPAEIDAVVPDLFNGNAGTTTLRVGVPGPDGQLFFSNPVSFIIRAIPAEVPPMAIVTGSDAVRVLSGTVPPSELYNDFVGGSALGPIGNTAGGIVIDRRGQVYWGRNVPNDLSAAGSVILKGRLDGREESTQLFSNNAVQIRDLALGQGDTLYAVDANGRIGYLNTQSPMSTPVRMYANLPLDSGLVNLKKAGQRLYWCSDQVVMSGNVDGRSATVDTAYHQSDILAVLEESGTQNDITAIAVDGTTGSLYIAFRLGSRNGIADVRILRGNVFGTEPLELLYTSDEFRLGATVGDMEINNGFLYWLNRSPVGDIFRVPLSGGVVPELVLSDISGSPAYFDLIGQ